LKYLVIHFHTSSNTKFAHLRYLIGLQNVRVRFLHSSWAYPELQESARISLRSGAEFLRNKRQFALPFVIEDTEVCIEAYRRSAGISYPGFDVKRWWQVTSFEEIDAKCRNAGTRAARQTSNLCLSLPGLDPFFFSGTITGEIAIQPKSSSDNPDTPWLNSRDFGSIFVPKGIDQPFGALNLDESLKFDFRKLAVDKLVRKLNEFNAVLNLDPSCYRTDENEPSPNQMPLFELPNRVVSTRTTNEC
jgi:inosine/xanthosine triphosphate pyrophosphatase family protein